MATYRFANDHACADLEVSDVDLKQIRGAMEARGYRFVERSPGLPTMRRLTADEVGSLFRPPDGPQVRGPVLGGGAGPVGVVAGDIRIRGGLAVPL